MQRPSAVIEEQERGDASAQVRSACRAACRTTGARPSGRRSRRSRGCAACRAVVRKRRETEDDEEDEAERQAELGRERMPPSMIVDAQKPLRERQIVVGETVVEAGLGQHQKSSSVWSRRKFRRRSELRRSWCRQRVDREQRGVEEIAQAHGDEHPAPVDFAARKDLRRQRQCGLRRCR